MGYKTFVTLVILASSWTFLRAEINATGFKNSVIVTSLTRSPLASIYDHLNILPYTLYDLSGTNFTYYYLDYLGLRNFNTMLLSLDVDYARKCLYIFDRNTGVIYALENFDWENKFDGVSLKIVHQGISRHFVLLSVDWVTNNIYWTDQMFGWIVVQSGSKKDTYKILVKDDLEKPLALVVSPVHKYMFWSDVGSTVKIERASLSGKNRQTIISTGLSYPASIDIDYTANKIVWVDSYRETVETANFDGTDRHVIRRFSNTVLYDVAVFQHMIGVTDLNNGSLVIMNKNTGEVVNSLRKKNGDPFVAITLYTAEIQQTLEDLCESKGCSDICVHENGSPVCMCKEGFKLNGGGVNCSEDLGTFHRALVWSNNSDICMMDIRSLTSNAHTDTSKCFLQGGTSISHFDIDMLDRKVIFADGQEIYSAKIGQNSAKTRLISTIGIITGIAVDWRDNNVYWCMGTTEGTVNLVSQETSDSYNLVNKNLTYPKDLNLLPFHNAMFWISGTFGAYKIEKSELAGTERHAIVSGGSLSNPKGLIVDHSTKTLYFIDAGYAKSCDVNGMELTPLTPTNPFNSPRMMLTYQNYLVVADNDFPTSVLKIFEKKSEPVLKYIQHAIDVDSMTDMKVLDATLQPNMIGPCAILNGDCEHICIPVGRNRICQCEYGFQIDANKESCSSTALTDNFLLVTDGTHNKIYQISLVTDDVVAVDTDTYGSPLAIVYSNVAQQVIWSSNQLVQGISLNGTGYRIILNTEMFSSHADGFAIDYTSGNIYYTANPVSITGFIGIGVISRDGLHKRLISFGANPRAIVLDSERGLLFWTDYGYKPAFVKKANMDGSNIATVLESGLVWPNGLAIDTKEMSLYVTDGATNNIHRCSYTGVCTVYYTDSEAHLMDIELLGDYLYYTAWNRPYVTKLHKTDRSIISRVGFKPELGRLHSVSLYSSTLTSPAVSEGCLPNNGRGPCSTFCFPKPSSYTCSCEDGVDLLNDEKTCENAQTTTTTPNIASTDKLEASSVPVIAGGVAGFIVLVAIAVIVVLIVIKGRSGKRRDNSNEPTIQNDPGFVISFISTPPLRQERPVSRPDTTYDLLKFDEPGEDSKSKDIKDNEHNDYMRLTRKQNEYEKLNSVQKSQPDINFRPSALPNKYQTMSDMSRNGSSQNMDDYLSPVTATEKAVTDEEFNSPVYVGDSTENNTNQYLHPFNQIPTITFSPQELI